MTKPVTAILSDISNRNIPSNYRVTFTTPDGVYHSRTGTLTECTTYARTKATEHNVLVEFKENE